MARRVHPPTPRRTAVAGWCAHLTPVGQAAALALALAAAPAGWALPQGATPTLGQVAVAPGGPGTLEIVQGSARAGLDWRSFSIAAGERVLIRQPDVASVLFNRVTGADPSLILGQLQANGRVFLSNPRGIVFGAGSQVDVGSLVATTLTLNTTALANGRYQLSGGNADTGELRADGSIRASSGTVALVAPSLSIGGNIVAGRLGLAAAAAVQVDVDGDGLIFFNARGEDLAARLRVLPGAELLGRSAELRAAARSGFADTVLNLDGVVRATGLGQRGGQVVIDGGSAGVTRVAGTVDVTGPGLGARGGDITVLGEQVWLDTTARLDARGDAGGGSVRVGGGWQGQGAAHNAMVSWVAPGATLDASAVRLGDGGTVVVWADGNTVFDGRILARGGRLGGDGGQVETSGKAGLGIRSGTVDAGAAPGSAAGRWLLDPKTITVATVTNTVVLADVALVATQAAADLTIDPSKLNVAAANVELQAADSITFSNAVAMTGAGIGLTARAGKTITVSAPISTTNGAILLSANDAVGTRDATPANAGRVVLGATGTLGAGTAAVTLTNNPVLSADPLLNFPGGTHDIGANITAGSLAVTGPVALSGVRTFTLSDTNTASTLTDTVSGTGGGLKKMGAGTLTLSAANTYDGGTEVAAGTLAFSGSGTAGDATKLVTVSAGTLDLRSGATLANPVTVTGGALASSVGGGTLSGTVTMGAELAVSAGSGSTLAITGVLNDAAGSFGLTKTGAGTLALGSANTYDGATAVNGGTLAIGADNRLGPVVNVANVDIAGPLTLNGGTLQATGGFTLNAARVLTLGAGGGVFDTGGFDLVLGHALAGGALTKLGAGTLTLATGNLHTGTTRVEAGTLKLPGAGTLPVAAVLQVAGGSLDLGNAAHTTGAVTMDSGSIVNGTLAGNGYTLKAGLVSANLAGGAVVKATDGSPDGGTVTLSGTNSYTGGTTVQAGALVIGADAQLGAVAGKLTLNGGTLRAAADLALPAGRELALGAGGGTLDNDGHAVSLSGKVTGTGALTMLGSGTLALTGDGTGFSGSTQVSAGSLTLDAASTLAGSALTLDNAAGVSLSLAASTTLGSLAGGGGSGGQVALGGFTLTVGGNDASTGFAGSFTGTAASGLVKQGNGRFELQAASTGFLGSTRLSRGTLALAHLDALAGSALVLDATPSAGLELAANARVGSLAGGGAPGADIDLAGFTLTVLGTNAAPTTFDGAINGLGGRLVKAGSGELKLTGSNHYDGGTTVSGGTLAITGDTGLGAAGSALTLAGGATLRHDGNAALSLSGPLALDTGGGRIDSNGQAVTVSGALSGSGALTKAGAGTLTLAGDGSGFTGATTVNAGVLAIDADSRLGAANRTLTLAGGTLQALGGGLSLDAARTLALGAGGGRIDSNGLPVTVAGPLTGSTTLTKRGSGTLTLAGSGSGFTGATSVEAGAVVLAHADALLHSAVTLQAPGNVSLLLQADATIGSLAGTTAGNTVDLDGFRLTTGGDGSSTTFGGRFFGSGGSLAKEGAGTFTLTQASTHTGGTRVGQGTLVVSADDQLGDVTAPLTLDGGTLRAAAGLSLAAGRGVVVGGAGGTVDSQGHTVAVAGPLSGTGAVTKQGIGTLALAGDGTAFFGNTRVADGTLVLNGANTLAGSALTLDNVAGVTLSLAGSSSLGSLAGLGGTVALGGSTLRTGAAGDTLFTGQFLGSGHLVKQGTGRFTLAAGVANQLADTEVAAGTLALSGAGVAAVGGITVQTGGLLDLRDGAVVNQGVTLAGGGLVNGAGTAELSGRLTLAADATVGVASALRLSGDVTETGSSRALTKTGSGTLTVAGHGGHSGGTRVSGGTLLVSGNGTLGSGDVGVDAGARLALQAAAALGSAVLMDGGSLAGGTGGGTLFGSVTLAANTTVDVAADALTISGTVRESGGARSLTKTGAGTLRLDSANSYEGGTSVQAGTLAAGASGSLGSGAVVVTAGTLALGANTTLGNAVGLQGGALSATGAGAQLSGAVTLANTTAVDVAPGASLTFSGSLAATAGNPALTKTGTGLLTLHASNSLGGGLQVNAGTLAIDADSRLGSAAAPLGLAGGTLLLEADLTVAATRAVTLGAASTIDTNGHSVTLAGALGGAGALTVQGGGTLALTGSNAGFNGNTTVGNGSPGSATLAIDGNARLGSGGTLTLAGGTLRASADLALSGRGLVLGTGGGSVDTGAHTVALGDALAGSGSLAKLGSGTLRLGGGNSGFSGSLLVSGGALAVASAGQLGTSASTLTLDGGTLLADADLALPSTRGLALGAGGGRIDTAGHAVTLAGALSGAHGLTKAGAGSLTLANANAGYSGITTVDAGTLALSGAGRLGSDRIDLAGGRFDLQGVARLDNPVNLLGGVLANGSAGSSSVLGGALSLQAATTFDTTGGLTLAGSLGGAGAPLLTKTGTGTLSLTGVDSHSGGTLVSQGTLAVAAGSAPGSGTVTVDPAGQLALQGGAVLTNALLLRGGSLANSSGAGQVAGSVTLAADSTVSVAAGSSLAFGGNLLQTGGDRALALTGGGTLTLTGNNQHGGGTTVQAGTLAIDSNAALGATGAALVLAGGTLQALADLALPSTRGLQFSADSSVDSHGHAVTLAGRLTGSGALAKLGAGTLTLAGINTGFSGDTRVADGTLAIDRAGRLGAGTASLVLAGGTLQALGDLALGAGRALVVDAASTVDTQGHRVSVAGPLGGSQALTKVGTGTLALAGSNGGFSGGLLVAAGTLAIDSDARLGAAGSPVTLSGGSTLQADADLALAATRPLVLGAGGGQVDTQAWQVTLAGPLSGSGSLAKQGTGSLTLTAANAVRSGDTTVLDGTLVLSGAGGVGSGGIDLAAGRLELQASTGLANVLTLGGGVLAQGGGASRFDGALRLTADTTVDVGGAGLTLTGALTEAGAHALNKAGAGVLTLRGASDHSGGTTVAAGTLAIDADSRLGAATGPLTLAGGTLRAEADLALGAARAVQLGAGGGTVDSHGHAVAIAGVVSGAHGLTKDGSGTLTLSGTNTYTGDTRVVAGTLALQGGQALADGTTLQLDNTAGARLQLLADETVGALTGGGAAGGDVALGAFTLTTGGLGGTDRFDGLLSGSGGLTKAGAGSLTLGGASGFAGSTHVAGGQLVLAQGTALAGSAVVVDTGATLALQADSGIGALAGGGTVALGAFTLSAGGNHASTGFDGTLQGSGGLTKQGTGALTLGGTSTYTGATRVDGGTLALAGAQALDPASAVLLSDTAAVRLALQSDQAIGSLAGGAVAGEVVLGGFTLSAGADGRSTTFAGAIGGTGGVVKQGGGTFTLSGANTYTGGTRVDAGTLALAGAQALDAAGAVRLSDTTAARLALLSDQAIGTLAGGGAGGEVALGGFTLTLGGGGGSATFAGAVGGSGGLVKQGSGTATLAGANRYTGTTRIDDGTLALQGGQALADTALVQLADRAGATLQLLGDETIGALAGGGAAGGAVALGSFTLGVGATSSTFAGVIGGSGGLDKLGAGRLTLSGANVYQGGTRLLAGTLATSGDQRLPEPGTLQMGNGATLALGGDQIVSALSDAAGQVPDRTARIELGTHRMTVRSSPGGADARFSGVLAADAGGRLVKEGGGLLRLAGNGEGNTVVLVEQGTLETVGAGALSPDSIVTVSPNATLQLTEALTIQTLNLGGILTSTGTGRLTTTAGTALDGALLASPLTAATLTSTGASTLAAPVVVGGSTTVTGGTLRLDPAGSLQTALLQVQAGATLATAGSGQLGGTVALAVAAGGLMDLGGAERASTLALAGTLQGNGRLDLGGRATLNGGQLLLPLGAAGLDSHGTATLGATLQLRDDLRLAGGTLTLDASGVIDAPLLTLQQGRLVTTAPQALVAGGQVVVARDATLAIGADTTVRSLQLAGVLAGPGPGTATLGVTEAAALDGGRVTTPLQAATVTSTGASRLEAPVQASERATLLGGQLDIAAGGRLGAPLLALQAGSLVSAAAQAIDNGTVLQMAPGSRLQLGGDQGLAALADLAGAGAAAEVLLGTNTLTVGSNGADSSFSGRLVGSGSLVKDGAGVLVLRADQAHGDTRIAAGTLQIGDGGSSGSLGSGAVVNDGTLRFDLGSDRTLALDLRGSGALVQAGRATLTLAGSGLAYTGATQVQSGVLRTAAADVLPDASAVAVAAAGRLVLAGAETVQALDADGPVVLGGSLRTSGDQRFGGAVTLGTLQPISLSAPGHSIQALNDGNQWGTQALSVQAGRLRLSAGRAAGAGPGAAPGDYRDLLLGEVTLTGLAASPVAAPPVQAAAAQALADADDGRSTVDAGRLQIGATVPAGQAATGVAAVDGLLQLDGGGLTLRAHAAPGYLKPVVVPGETPAVDPLRGREIWLASDLIGQGANSQVLTAAGSSLLLQSTAGGSINLGQVRNRLAGGVSALSGAAWNSAWQAVELPGGREVGQSRITLAGQVLQVGGLGLEADQVRLAAGQLATDAGSVITARLWYNDATFGADKSTPGLQLTLLPDAFTTERSFGRGDQPIAVSVGARSVGLRTDGLSAGFVQVLPKLGARGATAVFLAGPKVGAEGYAFFHDGAGDQLELPVYYNGVLPATPQLSGSLSAVASVSETARRERFEEAVRTENVAIRLRAGVIAEVGPGRSATQGSQGMRLPATCRADAGQLGCGAAPATD